MTLHILSGETVRTCVSMEACIDLMAATMISISRGQTSIPLRSSVALSDPRNAFVVMPGAISRPAAFGAKLISFFPGNRNLPAAQGLIVLFDGTSGRPEAIVDAASVTALRTGAASGAATRVLAREDAKTLALLGYGVQAEYHLEAMRAVRPIERVLVWGRSLEKSAAFIDRVGTRVNVELRAVPDARTAVEQADIVCTVTSSPTPVVQGEWLKPGAHLNLVGAYTPATREADTEAIRRSRLFVEIEEFALREAGELLIPIEAGELRKDHIAGEIADVLMGSVPGRTHDDEITAYKSLGNTAQDLATACFALEQAVRQSASGVIEITAFGS